MYGHMYNPAGTSTRSHTDPFMITQKPHNVKSTTREDSLIKSSKGVIYYNQVHSHRGVYLILASIDKTSAELHLWNLTTNPLVEEQSMTGK